MREGEQGRGGRGGVGEGGARGDSWGHQSVCVCTALTWREDDDVNWFHSSRTILSKALSAGGSMRHCCSGRRWRGGLTVTQGRSAASSPWHIAHSGHQFGAYALRGSEQGGVTNLTIQPDACVSTFVCLSHSANWGAISE